jgi:Tol biopolymer transport system component
VVTVGTEIRMFDAKGENGRTIYDSKTGQVTFPSWSLDGKAIAFGVGSYFTGHQKPAAVAMVNADGTGFRNLTDGPGKCGVSELVAGRETDRVSGGGDGAGLTN